MSVTEHQVNDCNKAITIEAGEPDVTTGCPSIYRVKFHSKSGVTENTSLRFQNGPIKEVGTNGLTHEALIAVILDRMRHFQSGKYACRENALAITKLEEAMHWLNHRTRLRELRGVEGTHTP